MRAETLQEIRMARFEDVHNRFMGCRLSASEAAEWLGVSERTFGRQRTRFEEEGLEGLPDRRLGRLSPHRVPVDEMEEANHFLREVYLPDHNRRFKEPATEGETAFVPVPGIELGDIPCHQNILCHQEERVVGNDNTVRFQGLVLQIPPSLWPSLWPNSWPSPWRPHFAKARVRVHRYHDGHLALFYGPLLIARFDREGRPIAQAHHRAA